MQHHEIYAGMVVLHQGRPAKVEKRNPKNIKIVHEDGVRWTAHPSFLTRAPEGTTFTLEVPEAKVVLGSVVRYRRGTAGASKHPGVYSICAISQSGIRMARLFGDENRYVYNVPATQLEIMTPGDLKAVLAYMD